MKGVIVTKRDLYYTITMRVECGKFIAHGKNHETMHEVHAETDSTKSKMMGNNFAYAVLDSVVKELLETYISGTNFTGPTEPIQVNMRTTVKPLVTDI